MIVKNKSTKTPRTSHRRAKVRQALRTLSFAMACSMLLTALALLVGCGQSNTQATQDLPTTNVPTQSAKPLFPTIATRSSYIAKSVEGSKNIGEEIKSCATILIDIDTYEVVAEKAPDLKIYPASMTKVMTLLVACERVTDLTLKLTVSKENHELSEKMDGSGIGLNVGETLSVKDMLYLISYQSDTIASLTIAEYIAGSEAEFVKLMNEKVRELGLTSTNFSNCSGLHNENNYTTCREMAAIMGYALDNRLCRQLLTDHEGYRMTTNEHPEGLTAYSGWYSGRFKDNPTLSTVVVKGGKTGYTDEAGVCLVSYAKAKNVQKEYISVICGLPKGSGLSETDSTAEVKYIYNNYAGK